MGEQVIIMPVTALRGLTILPGMVLHFDVNRPKSVAAVEKVTVRDQRLFFMAQRHPEIVEPELGELYQVGTIAIAEQLVKLSGEMVKVPVEGPERRELLCLDSEEPALIGEIGSIEVEEDELDHLTQGAILRTVRDKLEGYGGVNPKITKEILPNLLTVGGLNEILDQTVIQPPWDYTIRQTVLENSSLSARYEVVMYTLMTGMEIYRVKEEFQEKVKSDTDQNQKEYTLREQTRVIRQELGEDNPFSEADEYQKKLDNIKADKEMKEKLHKEIERFRTILAGSQKGNVLRTYIETLLDLFWKKMSRDNDDIRHAQKILDEDHYGLEQIKERILEYLAVRTLTKKGTSSVICLVGPPGAGKISIARSVVRAPNKKYVRISLGGIRDEAEIRGHKKTYVGAMPGRIVEGMRRVGVNNPLMLLDEIDRVSSDYKGDTSSVLLEVLGGEQNVKFRDHYVEVPTDLSQVLSIVIASTTQTILGLLLDRMELIEANSYTENEKFHAARDYLMGKQVECNDLEVSQIIFSDKSLGKIIYNYIREAGVRNLERRIGDVCGKTTRQFLEDNRKPIRITENNLEKYLGKEKVTFEDANEENQVGIVRGLAWTSVGGDTLQIEVNVMPDKGNPLMIGQLGDVVKESAQIALIYVRSVCPQYGVMDDYFERRDLHIHISEGTAPKDRPSAGITMVTAMLSVVTGRRVFAKAAMTGEITLKGRVFLIGGLKEEILVARMAHIFRVLVPDKNRLNIGELSREITEGLEIVFVKAMEDVVKEAFLPANTAL